MFKGKYSLEAMFSIVERIENGRLLYRQVQLVIKRLKKFWIKINKSCMTKSLKWQNSAVRMRRSNYLSEL